MKFTKLSLAAMAALSIASSAFAVENVKVDGQIKLWYQTTDTTAVSSDAATSAFKNDGIGKQTGATGDLITKVRATGDLTKKAGFGFTMYAATTLGLENNLVAGEAIGTGVTNDSGNTAQVTNGDANLPMWLGEAYFTYKAGNTIAKIGRQELDTPLAFTETWNAAPNTFEAAVLINSDIPKTKLIAAYVARGNGNTSSTVGSTFNSYGYTRTVGETDSGAYAIGMVNNSIPNLTIHPVYYNVQDVANATWIDVAYDIPKIMKIEALYANVEAAGATEVALAAVADKKTDAYAVKLSGAVAGVNVAGSYSNVSAGTLPVANTATGFTKTKIYTASILSDGRIAAQPDVTAWKVEASTKLAGLGLNASYASYDVKANTGGTRLTTGYAYYTLSESKSPSELDLSVSTKIDDINLTAFYIMQNEFAVVSTGESRDKTAVRVIASINF